MNLAETIHTYKGKKIAVIGIGVSNTPLIELLLRHGCDVTACDRSTRDKLGETAARLESLDAHLRLGEGYLTDLGADIIFRTPGMRPDVPELQDAVARGARLTSEMEVFFEVCPCPIIGVTGSDGKTTTTSIIAELLREAGKTVHIGGNIGTPLLTRADAMSPSDIAVVELSSFQLMTMTKSPGIAVVTNVTPNHLDVHRDLDEYIDAKRRIIKYQSPADLSVLNLDNDVTRDFACEAVGGVRYFSAKQPFDDGVFLLGGVIYIARESKIEKLMDASEIALPGAHNIENMMAAFTAVLDRVPAVICRHVAKTFSGVAHRIELVRTLRGVRYYNDSIASSPTRTIAGLRSFDKKVILIAGGKDKGIGFEALGEPIVQHVKTLVLTGPTAPKIRAAVESEPTFKGKPKIIEKEAFRDAVLAAHKAARRGDIVILSPACTSFDQFKNFEHRGNTYKEIINGLE